MLSLVSTPRTLLMADRWRGAVEAGRVASEAGRHAKAAERFSEALAALSAGGRHGQDDRVVIDVAIRRAAAMLYDGSLEEAANELEGIVERAELELGWGDEHMVRAALALGTALFRRGDVEAAGHWWQLCQGAIDEGCEVSDHVRLLILNNLGGVHYHRGDREAALASFARAADEMERTFGSSHRDLARPYCNVSWVALEAGRLNEARVAAERAVAVADAAMAQDDPERAHPLVNLGLVRNAEGRWREAADIFRSLRESLVASHPLRVSIGVNLAELHRWFGDLTSARRYADEAVEIAGRAMVRTDPTRLAALRATAALAHAAGDSATAQRRVEELLALETDLDTSRVDTRVATRAIAAEVAGTGGGHERQLALVEEGLRLLDAAPGLALPDVEARLRIGVVEALAGLGQRGHAKRELGRLDDLLEKVATLLPATRRRAAEARVRAAAGGTSEERVEASAAALALVGAQRTGAFGVLDLTERWRHAQRHLAWFEPLLGAPDLGSEQVQRGADVWFDHHEAATAATSALLRWHKLVDPSARAAAQAYAAALRRLASGVALPETSDRTALLRGVQHLERTLGAGAFEAVERALASVGHVDALSVLSPGETVVVIAWLERLVVVLRIDERRGVERTAVAPTHEIGTLVERVRSDAQADRRMGAAMETYLLERLMPPDLLEGESGTRLIIVPDGATALVPWGALLDRYRVTRGLAPIDVVQSTSVRRMVTTRRTTAPSSSGPSLIVAAPDFGADSRSAGDGFRGPLLDAAATSASYRTWLADLPIPRLDHAVEEARVVQRAVPDAVVATGAEATVERVLAVTRPRVLHLATHSFVYPGTDDLGLPLLRPVLAFAGARAAARAAPHAPTAGFLPALGASTLDLEGTELVVLSACDSGVGVTVPGEGVAGMPQALLDAGAGAVLATLWRVEDRAAVSIVEAFYAHLAHGMLPSTSLLTVQRGRGHDTASSAFVCWA